MQITQTTKQKMNFSLLLTDFKQLTKVGLSLSVVFSSVAGYLLAVDTIDFNILFLLAIGGYLMVGASNAFNQVIEHDTDALMKRTMNRPIPAGRMSIKTGLLIAVIMAMFGIAILYSINPKSAFFGVISIFIYTSIYTPLKSKTPLSVFVGGIPGAIPFMLGWVAATDAFGIEPGMLFIIQFFWQFPHFWAIAWLQFDEYKKAGFNLMPMGKKDGNAIRQIIIYTICLMIVSVLPVLKMTGSFYIHPITAIIVFSLGAYMLYFGFRLYKHRNDKEARKLMLSSVLYITLVQIIYVVDKFLH